MLDLLKTTGYLLLGSIMLLVGAIAHDIHRRIR
jgi:hypothetical protein